MTKPSLSAVRDLDLSKTSPCSRCEHAEFIHGYAGPCLVRFQEKIGDSDVDRVQSSPGYQAASDDKFCLVRASIDPV